RDYLPIFHGAPRNLGGGRTGPVTGECSRCSTGNRQIIDRHVKNECSEDMNRVALLLNFVPPHGVPVLEALRDRLATLRVLISTPMEPKRDWPVLWGGLDVVVQRSFTLTKRRRHPAGFAETGYVH